MASLKNHHNTPATPATGGAASASVATAATAPAAAPTDENKSTATPVTNEEKKALFGSFAAEDEKVATAEKHLEAARHTRSAAIAKIVDRVGRGPFKFRGEEITFAKGRNSDGSEDARWTKRMKQEKEVQSIE